MSIYLLVASLFLVVWPGAPSSDALRPGVGPGASDQEQQHREVHDSTCHGSGGRDEPHPGTAGPPRGYCIWHMNGIRIWKINGRFFSLRFHRGLHRFLTSQQIPSFSCIGEWKAETGLGTKLKSLTMKAFPPKFFATP